MLDPNWDMIDGDAAHEIEVLNYSNQVNVIEALFHFLCHHGQVTENGCSHYPNENVVRELHRTGTLFLLLHPGEYRDSPVHLAKADGTVVYRPPHHDQVPDLMRQFVIDISKMWASHGPIETAAFALWRINWIHPFKNGNGRTARAFSYACLCLKLGFMPGGSPTVIDLIMRNKPEFEQALAAGDQRFAATGQPDLVQLEQFLLKLFMQQLEAIPNPG
ncbi:Fic family protein [Rhizorhabdus sp.]|uniref:Fic family protein n=1 Tax=Rhizorhabdus sp. TaxID=1968843 RepID=UPI0035B4F688